MSVSCKFASIWLTFTADMDYTGTIVGVVVVVGESIVIVVVVVVIWKTKGGKGMFLHVYMHAPYLWRPQP